MPAGMPGIGTKSTNSLRLLDVSTGRQLQAIPLSAGLFGMGANSALSSSTLSFSPDGRVVASASGFSSPITLRDVSTGQELRTLKTTGSLTLSPTCIAWSADGLRLASAHFGFKRDPNTLTNDTFSFEDLSFTIRIWDTQTGTELSSLTANKNFVNSLAFSRDGRMLASEVSKAL